MIFYPFLLQKQKTREYIKYILRDEFKIRGTTRIEAMPPLSLITALPGEPTLVQNACSPVFPLSGSQRMLSVGDILFLSFSIGHRVWFFAFCFVFLCDFFYDA